MSNVTISKEEIQAVFPKVSDTIADALGCDKEEVKLDSSLIEDLGAESIDFLDIVFRLEKEFGIEVARGELFPQELLRDPAMVVNGALTDAGIAALKERFAFTDLSALRPGASVDDLLNDLLTVGLIVDYVESKLRTASVQQA